MVLAQLRPALIVMEATGGLERPLLRALVDVALPVIVVNPSQVRDFAKATGQLAMTDTLDAQVLARFAEVIRPALRVIPDAPTQELAVLLARRRQVLAMQQSEQHPWIGLLIECENGLPCMCTGRATNGLGSMRNWMT